MKPSIIHQIRIKICTCEELLKPGHFAKEASVWQRHHSSANKSNVQETVNLYFTYSLKNLLRIFAHWKTHRTTNTCHGTTISNLHPSWVFAPVAWNIFHQDTLPHQFGSVLKINLSKCQQCLNWTLPWRDQL